MTQNELYESVTSIKLEYLSINEVYFNKLMIGDKTSFIKHREYLIALDIHIQCLEYCYNVWESLEELEITNSDISTTIAAAISCLRTFNPVYYG
jgi:hypothetical protein